MATHAESKQPSTRIQDSTVNIETLNVNKTTTTEAIYNALPKYHEYLQADVLTDLNTNKVYIQLNPSVNPSFLDFVQVFKNGILLDRISENNNQFNGFYIYPAGTRIDLLGAAKQNIDNSTVFHILYTEQI